MEALFKNVLDDTEGLKEIYASIDTYDMAEVVRAAMNALIKAHTLPMNLYIEKSKALSTVLRKEGNEHYKAGRHREAICLYNKALAYAPYFSEEMMVLYGNRSAVFFSIKYFTACYQDIETCLQLGCCKSLVKKLVKRREDAIPCLLQEHAIDMMTSTEFVSTFLNFNCKKNADVPCASADVAFVNQNGAKQVTAGKTIKAGTVVAIEQAFASCTGENKYLTCYYCNRPDLRLHPCDRCCQALFCSKECQERCLNEYHRIECQVVDYLGSMYEKPEIQLMTRTAIKLSLKMGWDAMICASRDIGASRMNTSSVRQTFNSEEPLSILSYDDDIHFLEGRIFNGSLICAAVLHRLALIPGYFPNENKKSLAVLDAMARVMLHMYVTFTNKIPIKCSAYDFNSASRCFRSEVQTNYGWFSMSSKLKHSCEPNLYVVGLNDSVGLVSLRTINKGEELTISYIGHFYDFALSESKNELERATHLFLKTQHMCDCRVCTQNWDANSAVKIEMTQKLAALFRKVNAKSKSMDYKCFYDMCDALNSFPVNSYQHKCAYDNVKSMIKPIQSKYKTNVTHT